MALQFTQPTRRQPSPVVTSHLMLIDPRYTRGVQPERIDDSFCIKESQPNSRELSMINETLSDKSKSKNERNNVQRSTMKMHIMSTTQQEGGAVNDNFSDHSKERGEKFILAKNHNDIEVLLELMQSNDTHRSNSFIDNSRQSALSKGYQGQKNNLLRLTNISNQTNGNQMTNSAHSKDASSMVFPHQQNEMKSDLKKDWMQPEQLISHSAINQLSYLMLQKKKEVKLHSYYNTDFQSEKIQDLIDLRKQIMSNFELNKSIEKRIQRYLLMADDAGIQCSLYLLLLLSDDEIKGHQVCELSPEARSSISSIQSPLVDKGQSILSQSSKLKKNDSNSKRYNKEFKSGWFKKQTNQLIDSIDHVICDQSFSRNSVRLAILFIGNLYKLNKRPTSGYARKKATYQKFLAFFDQERDQMTEEELIEVESILKLFYSHRELYGLTKRQQQIQRLKEAYMIKTGGDSNTPRNKQGNLIRQDSVDSLIEMIQQDKLQQSLYDEKEKSIHHHRHGIQVSYTRKTESLGPDSMVQFYNKDKQLRKKKETFNDQDEMMFQQNPDLLRIKFDQSSQPSQLSQRSRDRKGLHKYNDSYGNYCYTLESQTKNGTPIDQTFLDNMQESILVKEKSFYNKNRIDTSREEYKTNSAYHRSPKQTFQSKRLINSKLMNGDLSPIADKSPESNLEYDHIDITKQILAHTQEKSTFRNTRISSKKKKGQLVRSFYSSNDVSQQSGCCNFMFGTSKPKQHKRSDDIIRDASVNDRKISGSKESSIQSFARCQHKVLDGKMCEECQSYERQKQETKEKLSDCAIF